MGGASSFLGATTFFSGTFFLISGTLKTPFHDKNVFLKSKKEAKSLYTQEDHHAAFTQKEVWNLSCSPSRDYWDLQGERSANGCLSEARCYHFMYLNFTKT